MRSTGEIIAAYRKKLKLSQPELASRLEQYGHKLTNKAISKWETGISEPGISVFMDLCRILGITSIYEEYFNENPDNPISRLNEEGRQKVYEYADLLLSSGRYSREKALTPLRCLPLQLYPVSAGPGNFLSDENYENIPVSDDVPSCADFGVRVSGDSMEPAFHSDQILWIHKQPYLESGEIGIFFLDGEAYVKQFRQNEHGIFLVSLNPSYAPIPVNDSNDFRIFGKVVA